MPLISHPIPHPAIPAWMRSFACTGYLNVHALRPPEHRVFGTESMFGDWGARVLLLAQDFCTASLFEQRSASGEDAYTHVPKLPTNVNLSRFTQGFRPHDLLYGSALVGLLKRSPGMGDPLPDPEPAIAYGRRVLREVVIPSMPNLRAIACLGRVAWECAAGLLPHDGPSWAEARAIEQGVPLPPDVGASGTENGHCITLHAMYHPSPRAVNPRRAEVARAWDALRRTLEARSTVAPLETGVPT